MLVKIDNLGKNNMEDVIVNNCESKLLFEDCSFDIFLIVVL